MKLYIINPLYTSLCFVIVFAVYVSSIELFVLDGKQYLNYKYEIIFGGPKVLRKIEGATFGGVKRVRTLTPDEIIELRVKRNQQKEIERKQVEEREREKKQEEEERQREQEEKEKERKQKEEKKEKKRKQEEEKKEKERKLGERRGIKGPIRNTKKAQPKAGASQYEIELVQSNTGQQIRRTLSNKQNVPLGRLPRRKKVYV